MSPVRRPPGCPIPPVQQRPPVSRKTPASVPLHSNYLTITTPYKNVELFFGIVSVLARNEEWNTSSALRTEEIKGFSRKLKDSTQNRKPANASLQGCSSVSPKNPMRKTHGARNQSKASARGRRRGARALRGRRRHWQEPWPRPLRTKAAQFQVKQLWFLM